MAAVPVALPIFHLWPLLPPPKRRRRSHKPYPFRSSTLIALLILASALRRNLASLDSEVVSDCTVTTGKGGGVRRMILIGREGSEGIPIGKLLPLVPTRLMIGVQLRKHRLRIKLLYPLLVEDLIGEGVLSQTVMIPIWIGGPKGRKRKVDGDLPPMVVHSTV
ncbi:hypothetical protein KY290_026257 [Solanum tuberosum]|uniref:Uncharacterized protein n=1 Tax=Solanum tuberosum TaxID=4113 RepID=A0ABQ7UVX1_SOLTU|nr:hypothetical protein KY290_026257 [Solanum tuberosum]